MSVPSSAQGLLFVLAGPSGVGKTSIMQGVRDHFGASFSVSATTRQRTAEEEEGVDYYFLDEPSFQGMIDRGEFLEHAQVFGRHWYGTPRQPVEAALGSGTMVILDIDVQGARQVRESMPEAYMMFILPPSEEELLIRLRERGRDDEEAIQRRYGEAKKEIAFANESGCFDDFLVNDDLETTIAEAISLIENRRNASQTSG